MSPYPLGALLGRLRPLDRQGQRRAGDALREGRTGGVGGRGRDRGRRPVGTAGDAGREPPIRAPGEAQATPPPRPCLDGHFGPRRLMRLEPLSPEQALPREGGRLAPAHVATNSGAPSFPCSARANACSREPQTGPIFLLLRPQHLQRDVNRMGVAVASTTIPRLGGVPDE